PGQQLASRRNYVAGSGGAAGGGYGLEQRAEQRVDLDDVEAAKILTDRFDQRRASKVALARDREIGDRNAVDCDRPAEWNAQALATVGIGGEHFNSGAGFGQALAQ